MRDLVPPRDPTDATRPRTVTTTDALALLAARLPGIAALLAAFGFVVYGWWPR